MAKVSRRKLIGAAAAAPLALQFGAQENPRKSIDPIIAQAAAWISEHERRDALMREWQDLEVALSERCKVGVRDRFEALFFQGGMPPKPLSSEFLSARGHFRQERLLSLGSSPDGIAGEQAGMPSYGASV